MPDTPATGATDGVSGGGPGVATTDGEGGGSGGPGDAVGLGACVNGGDVGGGVATKGGATTMGGDNGHGGGASAPPENGDSGDRGDWPAAWSALLLPVLPLILASSVGLVGVAMARGDGGVDIPPICARATARGRKGMAGWLRRRTWRRGAVGGVAATVAVPEASRKEGSLREAVEVEGDSVEAPERCEWVVEAGASEAGVLGCCWSARENEIYHCEHLRTITNTQELVRKRTP